MRYLILDYTESPINSIDFPDYYYCHKSNLNKLYKTGKCAVDYLDNLSTESFTKTFNKDSEASLLFLTKTITLVSQENDDDDRNAIRDALITMTTTKFEVESTDKD
ncbi:hypothetical protein MHJ94_03605 [Chryseobacterium taklimakanense]|uniref:Uncharacterized protein n=1 Tax=Chryseobacterium taklimakanense TaxID=536441 RepID=A0A239X5S4_9FLAO|nr:hypothetical protein [Chryseobacterium taklimakanense]MCG7280375.1 hypothetical protein [Chryseobacterium taklimakanense]SNV42065.1 Uncharacterised protein [Chryseobacterium taklimakanense]